mgnify:FL=1
MKIESNQIINFHVFTGLVNMVCYCKINVVRSDDFLLCLLSKSQILFCLNPHQSKNTKIEFRVCFRFRNFLFFA